MISYKQINLMDIYIHDKEIRYDTTKHTLTIKSPIIIAEKYKDSLILKNNPDSVNHDTFINVCGYINTICNINKIKTNIIINNKIVLKKTDNSKFFDENKNNISFLTLRDKQKVICSFTCKDGCFLISQCLLIE